MGSGGGGGIRTRDTVSRIHTFQACAFDRSATPPLALRFEKSEGEAHNTGRAARASMAAAGIGGGARKAHVYPGDEGHPTFSKFAPNLTKSNQARPNFSKKNACFFLGIPWIPLSESRLFNGLH